jgi:hypothetical protein
MAAANKALLATIRLAKGGWFCIVEDATQGPNGPVQWSDSSDDLVALIGRFYEHANSQPDGLKEITAFKLLVEGVAHDAA